MENNQTWNEIRKWYENNGFFDTVANMDDIKRAWFRRPAVLLDYLRSIEQHLDGCKVEPMLETNRSFNLRPFYDRSA